MTTERKQSVLELIARLEECKTDCDDLTYFEEMQRNNLINNRSNIAADECSKNYDKIMNAFCKIEKAIESLREVDK
jgi:hypothetical protein